MKTVVLMYLAYVILKLTVTKCWQNFNCQKHIGTPLSAYQSTTNFCLDLVHDTFFSYRRFTTYITSTKRIITTDKITPLELFFYMVHTSPSLQILHINEQLTTLYLKGRCNWYTEGPYCALPLIPTCHSNAGGKIESISSTVHYFTWKTFPEKSWCANESLSVSAFFSVERYTWVTFTIPVWIFIYVNTKMNKHLQKYINLIRLM